MRRARASTSAGSSPEWIPHAERIAWTNSSKRIAGCTPRIVWIENSSSSAARIRAGSAPRLAPTVTAAAAGGGRGAR